jgi:signal transduction histidine kinase
MSIYSFPPLLCSLFAFLLGFFVYLQNKKSIVNVSFALLCLFTFWWQFCWSILFSLHNEDLAFFVVRLGYTGIIFIPYAFYHFVISFLKIDREKHNVILFYLLGLVFVIILWSSNYFISGYYHYRWGYYPKANITHIVYLFSLFFSALRGFIYLIKSLMNEKTSPAGYNQLKYTLIAFIIYTFSASDFIVNYGVEFYPLGFLAVIISTSIFAYTIVRFRLLHINVALTRTGIFLIVYTLVLGIPFWIGNITKSWLISTSIAVILASLGPIIFQVLRKRAEAVILQEQRYYHNVLTELSATLTLIKDLDRLLKLIVYRVARAVKVKFACIYLATDGHKFVQKFPYSKFGFVPQLPLEILDNSAVLSYIRQKRKPIFFEELSLELKNVFNLHSGLIVPAFVRDRLLGFLILGPKQSGAVYAQEDAAVFSVLANQMALAIENTEFITESQKTQAQLFAAERMASMGTMAGGMSHQLNNRFHALALAAADAIDTFNFTDISSCSQGVKDSMGSIKYALTRILENVKHGGKIVNDFLDFSQPGKVKREAKEFDLREPLDRAIEMVRIKTSFPGDLIEKQITGDLPQIPGDFVLLQDVFYNLIDNAYDAVVQKEKLIKDGKLANLVDYKGKIIIRVDQFNAQLRIQIRDNGTGMDEETQKQVFVPYFTSKATAYKGAGLGLYIIQKIIVAHHGELNLVSKYGEGSTFTITLPSVQQDEKN